MVNRGGHNEFRVLTYCRNGDYHLGSFGYRESSVQMIPELNDRCKDG